MVMVMRVKKHINTGGIDDRIKQLCYLNEVCCVSLSVNLARFMSHHLHINGIDIFLCNHYRDRLQSHDNH